jgi:hypothetical protein
VKNLSPFIDPISISVESTRDLFYLHSSIFNLSILHNIYSKISQVNIPFNVDFFIKNTLNYFLGYNVNSVNYGDFYKDQYRPMNKGVSNMIKLHNTGAIAMPIETRLHILASSKDVIHS